MGIEGNKRSSFGTGDFIKFPSADFGSAEIMP